jgi:hypothetical protein
MVLFNALDAPVRLEDGAMRYAVDERLCTELVLFLCEVLRDCPYFITESENIHACELLAYLAHPRNGTATVILVIFYLHIIFPV